MCWLGWLGGGTTYIILFNNYTINNNILSSKGCIGLLCWSGIAIATNTNTKGQSKLKKNYKDQPHTLPKTIGTIHVIYHLKMTKIQKWSKCFLNFSQNNPYDFFV